MTDGQLKALVAPELPMWWKNACNQKIACKGKKIAMYSGTGVLKDMRGEIKKLGVEIWNLKVKGTNVVSYNQRFQELALMCARMFPEESNKIKRYVGGLPDMIHGSVMSSKPKTMQDAIEFVTELVDEKISTFA
ncbi:hypothetical protein Tco_0400912 [Tanacetum coccineum]